MFSFPSANIVISPLRVVSALAFSISVLSSPHPGARHGIVDGLCDRTERDGRSDRHETLRRQESPTERHSKPREELENEAEKNPLLGHVIARATLAVIQEEYEAAPENLTSPVLLTACLNGAEPGVISFLVRAKPELVKVMGPSVSLQWKSSDNMTDGRLPIHCLFHSVLTQGQNPSSGVPAVEDVRALLDNYPESGIMRDPCTGLDPLSAVCVAQFSGEISRCVAETILPHQYTMTFTSAFGVPTNGGVINREAFDRDTLQALCAMFRRSNYIWYTFDVDIAVDGALENILCMFLLSKKLIDLDIQVGRIVSSDGGEVKLRRMLAAVARMVEMGGRGLHALTIKLPQSGGWELADLLCRLPDLRRLKVRVPTLTQEAFPFLRRVLGEENKIRNVTLQMTDCEVDVEPFLNILRQNKSLEQLHIGCIMASDDSISTWNNHFGDILKEGNTTLFRVGASTSYVASSGEEETETITDLDYFTKLNKCGRQIMKSTKGSLFVEDFVELLGLVDDDPNATHNDLLMTNAYYWLLHEGLEVWARVASQT